MIFTFCLVLIILASSLALVAIVSYIIFSRKIHKGMKEAATRQKEELSRTSRENEKDFWF